MPYFYDKYLPAVKKAIDSLEQAIYTDQVPLTVECWKTAEPVSFADRRSGEYRKLSIGDRWGDLFDCAWFRFTGTVPTDFRGKRTVLLIDNNGEGLVVDDEGRAIHGLTCKNCDYPEENGIPIKRVVQVSEAANGGEAIDLWVEGAANDLLGVLRWDAILKEAYIAVLHEDRRQLFWDLSALYDLVEACDPKSTMYKATLIGLYEATSLLYTYSEEEIAAVRAKVAPLFRRGGDAPVKITAIGHSHMDLAWLWPIRETKRKGIRTFATVLYNMDRYPNYVFGASQPQLYEWIKEDNPELYARVKEKVKEGRWELQGGMWTEADTNVSGGEALVRQFLYGKRFYRDEFGVDVKNLWLPDVFGYNAALPQLIKKSGCEYFMTQKLSWCQHNKFPHQTFTWRGIDGSEVFAHMLPAETYSATLLPSQLRFSEENYIDAGIADEALMLFGIGDGGGGPGENHLEMAERVKSLYGFAPVTQGFAQSLLERLEEKTRGKRKTFVGELYLERHQGTYTTQGATKWWNRRMELLLRELEYALVLADACTHEVKAELDRIWKEVLLYQFHDILPGSSIRRVYEEQIPRYEALFAQTEQLLTETYRTLVGDGATTVFNPLSFDRTALLFLDGCYYRAEVPAMGSTATLTPLTALTVTAAEGVLENENLIARFAPDGALISLIHKENGTESLKAPSGVLAVYRDELGDAWDFSPVYLDSVPERFTLVSQTFTADLGRAVCHQTYTYGSSTVTADVILADGSDRLEYDLQVDWHEKLKMLRTSFATSVMTDTAAFEIQFGLIHRSNNNNFLLQAAQYEECAQKWVDLSEGGYGVSLLNDCKYGHLIKENVIDLNLLRSQVYPDPQADEGMHRIRYALYPHIGGVKEARVTEKALDFNLPVRVIRADGEGKRSESRFAAEGVIIEALKPAEDGRGVILRAYEPYGASTAATLRLDRVRKVTETNLIEDDQASLGTLDCLELPFAPFEIRTFRLE